jgi:uncharacterized protein (TIGR03066 family)
MFIMIWGETMTKCVLLSFGLVLVASGLAPTTTRADDKSDALIGKWVPASGKEKSTFVVFTKDGIMTYTFGPKDEMTWQGKYKVIDEKKIEVEWTAETLKKNNLLSDKPKKVSYKLIGDDLEFDPALANIKKNWSRSK